MLLYEKIVDLIESQVKDGVLLPGHKAPSIRKLSRQQKVSVATVVQAYSKLEEQGYIEARPKSGFVVRVPQNQYLEEPRASELQVSAKNIGMNDLVSTILQAAKDPAIAPFGVACPSPDLYPLARINQIIRETLRDQPRRGMEYLFPPGLKDLRRQLAKHASTYQCQLTSADIVTTSGAMEALVLCLQAIAKPGDLIAVESPTYFGVLQALEAQGLRVLEIPTHFKEGVDLDALRDAIRKHKLKGCIFMPSCQNPVGFTMSDRAKKELVALLAANGIPLIENDAFGDLSFESSRPVPAKAFDKEGLVLYVSTFSKTLAAGLRVAWVAPGRYTKELKQLKGMVTGATCTLSELVVSGFLKSGGFQKHLRHMRRVFQNQVQRMSLEIAQAFPEGIRVSRPEGGFVLWVDLPQSVDSLELFERALQQKIGISPGSIFSLSGGYSHSIRINCGYPWTPFIDRSIQNLGKLVYKMESGK